MGGILADLGISIIEETKNVNSIKALTENGSMTHRIESELGHHEDNLIELQN